MRTCRIEGCPNPPRGHGLCRKHYLRWYKYGDPLALASRPTESERFWAKVDLSGECWLWTASTIRGYGQFKRAGGQTTGVALAHRWAYESLVGPIPDGLDLDHLCRQPLCVNPAHLEPVTHAENVRRGEVARKGRRRNSR